MEVKENVYMETTQTENAVAMAGENGNQQENGPQEVSAVLGKFKNVDALAQAYESLQSEFTRRSQRLKDLEKQVENFKQNKVSGNSGVEKLRKNAQMHKAEEEKFDEFVKELNSVQESAKKPTGDNTENSNTEEKATENLAQALELEKDEKGNEKKAGLEGTNSFVANNVESSSSSEEVYAKASRDEKVRLRIIGEYLSSLGKSGVPITAGVGSVLTTPPTKAKNIGEAGNMALQYFKKA